jgi:hypothetical protein
MWFCVNHLDASLPSFPSSLFPRVEQGEQGELEGRMADRGGTERWNKGNNHQTDHVLVPPVPPSRSLSVERFPSWFPLFHLFPFRNDKSRLKPGNSSRIGGQHSRVRVGQLQCATRSAHPRATARPRADAIWAATAALLRTRATLAVRLRPTVVSKMRASRKGVTALPLTPAPAACPRLACWSTVQH